MKTILVDGSDYRHIRVTGEDRQRYLNGMVTGEIRSVTEDKALMTMTLSHKARILSIFYVSMHEGDYIISCQLRDYDTTYETLDKHIVMDDVELDEVELPMHLLWPDRDSVWTASPNFSEASGASTVEEVECRRVEAGLPRYGVDVTDANFPFESPLVRLVNYEKGCFTGQEPVSRVHHRGGGGSKKLMGLRSVSGEPLEVGATLSTSEKAAAGLVTSVAQSPDLGSIALAYVHKSGWDEGAEVRVLAGAGELTAQVCSLPFA